MKAKVLEKQSEKLLTVKIMRAEACGKCKGCLAGQIETEMDLDAKNLCDAEIGDWVELELEENVFFRAVTIAYGIPFLFFVLGMFFGQFVISPLFPNIVDGLISFTTAMIFVLFAYGWLKSQNHKWENGNYTPLAVRLTEPDLELEEKFENKDE